MCTEDDDVCPWCRKPIKLGESSIFDAFYREPMHLDCSADAEEDAFFDRDMGFGDN